MDVTSRRKSERWVKVGCEKKFSDLCTGVSKGRLTYAGLEVSEVR